MFSRACYHTTYLWLQVFPRLPPVYCFVPITTGYKFSRACSLLLVFPRLLRITCFPALVTTLLATGYMFSRTCHWLYVSPHLPLVTSFPALCTDKRFRASTTDFMFSLWVLIGLLHLLLDYCWHAHGDCFCDFTGFHFLCRAINNWYQVVKTSSLSKQQRRQLQKDVQDRFQVKK